ncbi:MAG: hypothetical protein LBR57_00990 [Alistipes sp.]|jgi:hypothetical protein|nr:hypothetical protein [Alistipes sp.]
MKDKSKHVVDDTWINTLVDDDDPDTSRWSEIEQSNATLNPDDDSLDWRG